MRCGSWTRALAARIADDVVGAAELPGVWGWGGQDGVGPEEVGWGRAGGDGSILWEFQ